MPIEKILQLLSFALGFAGFVGSLVPKRSSRTASSMTRSSVVVLLTCLVAFVATGSASIWQSHQRSAHLQGVSEEMLQILGNEAKSIDQLHEGLAFEDLGTVSEALALLVKSKKVGHRVVDVQDDANLQYRARLFFAKK